MIKSILLKKTFLSVIILLCIVSYTPAYSASDIKDLKQYVSDFVIKNITLNDAEQIKVDILNLDSGFTVPSCKDEMKINFAKKNIPTENNSIELSCPSFPEWHIFVPIYIHVYTPVLSATHYMPSGTQITESDVYLTMHDKKLLREGYYTSPQEILGLSTLHAIPAGVAFTTKNVKQRTLVKRNHMVKLILKQGGLKIDMNGIAKSDGTLNEAIKVMNPSSKKIIYAVVTGPDRVEIITN